jgi:hypothetical protein
MPTATAPDQTKWMTALDAARTLGAGRQVLPKLAAEGRLTVRAIPFTRPLYSLASVERLARESVRPATHRGHADP